MASNYHMTDQILPIVVRQLRKQLGLSQEELAFRCDLTIASVSRIERGKTDPAWSSVCAVARGLNISMCELIAAIDQAQQAAAAATASMS